jgi:RNA polymerase sigma factor (sigma-70 family)
MEALTKSQEAGAPDDGASTFIHARSRIMAAALRTLGNPAEAEDVAQDVWLRWQNVDRSVVRDARAFLTTAAIRLAINRATRARTRHETPLTSQLAEPVDHGASPGLLAERGQSLESALRLLLEKLSPSERAAFVLREAFSYKYEHIARIVRVSEANSRQLVTRARKHLVDRRPVPVAATELRRLVVAFSAATQRGDLASLEAILSADIVDSAASNAESRRAAFAPQFAA